MYIADGSGLVRDGLVHAEQWSIPQSLNEAACRKDPRSSPVRCWYRESYLLDISRNLYLFKCHEAWRDQVPPIVRLYGSKTQSLLTITCIFQLPQFTDYSFKNNFIKVLFLLFFFTSEGSFCYLRSVWSDGESLFALDSKRVGMQQPAWHYAVFQLLKNSNRDLYVFVCGFYRARISKCPLDTMLVSFMVTIWDWWNVNRV